MNGARLRPCLFSCHPEVRACCGPKDLWSCRQYRRMPAECIDPSSPKRRCLRMTSVCCRAMARERCSLLGFACAGRRRRPSPYEHEHRRFPLGSARLVSAPLLRTYRHVGLKILTAYKLLKALEHGIGREIFILSFPRSSTGKSHRPQFLHKGARFLCCEARQTG
jgi:hypothetical protein